MHLPLGTFSPDVKIGLVSASRNCFPRSLSEQRTTKLLKQCGDLHLELFVPQGDCRIIESKDHAHEAARQMKAAGCDAAVLYLGNFSPEIEDANFVKSFDGPVMVIAAAEESGDSLMGGRGDALCGLLSAVMAVNKRGLLGTLHIPQDPLVSAVTGAQAIDRFRRIVKIVKGVRNSTIGLFGPRPRDFETCNYNISSIASLGIEVEELGFFDLASEVKKAAADDLSAIIASMKADVPTVPNDEVFQKRLASYEKAILNLRDRLKLSGATTQCWTEQENELHHVPCFINARMAARGFPVACENDAYSLTAELIGQYASDASVTVLDLNHSIPVDLHASLKKYPAEDLTGLFHCGNTDPRRMVKPQMKYQLIMNRLMEPSDKAPDITRGTIEGQIAASPATVLQVHGVGDKIQAFVCQGEFLDIDPRTFGATGTAYLPGFRRFYRHVLLGRFHHHAAIAFSHCGSIIYDAMKLLGVETVYTPLNGKQVYEGENPFEVR